MIQVSALLPAVSCFPSLEIFPPEVFQHIGRKLLLLLQRGRKWETLRGVSPGSEPTHKLLKRFHHSGDKRKFTASHSHVGQEMTSLL